MLESRILPDFIIVGAQKAGTTSLYHYLSQHPQLIASRKKEVHFFDGGLRPGVDNFSRGIDWYSSFFPCQKDVGIGCRIFEASPLYMFNPLVPGRIADYLPDVKIIVILRNPTERAISQYFHEKKLNIETLPIFDALLEEEKRLELVLENKEYQSHNFIHFSYKSRGIYKEQLERYMQYFAQEKILIIESSELFGNTPETLNSVFKFLGVDEGFKIVNLAAHNTGDKTAVEPSVYQYLNNYFKTHNEELFELLGKDFKWY